MHADGKTKRTGKPKHSGETRGGNEQHKADVWDRSAWCEALGIGLSTFYVLSEKPKSVHIGRLLKIIESPGAYARRVAKLQATGEQAAA